jgi:hypothetical protein
VGHISAGVSMGYKRYIKERYFWIGTVHGNESGYNDTLRDKFSMMAYLR